MSEKHTPGPWLYFRGSHSIYSESGRAICITCGPRKGPTDDEVAERQANACLIAAAPDLLEALRDCIASLGGIKSDAVPETARAAIARATGATS